MRRGGERGLLTVVEEVDPSLLGSGAEIRPSLGVVFVKRTTSVSRGVVEGETLRRGNECAATRVTAKKSSLHSQ